MMLRREMADRIGGGHIAGEQKRLAAAAAEVDLPAFAAPARLGHPRGSAKSLEHRRIEPDRRERRLADVGKLQSRNLAGALAGEHGTVGSDCQKDPSPAVETGLGELLKIVRKDVQDLGTIAEPFA